MGTVEGYFVVLGRKQYYYTGKTNKVWQLIIHAERLLRAEVYPPHTQIHMLNA